ncbi:MAG: hypothetical protein AABZ64_17980 [Nitrospinota bacterium]
MRFLDSRNLGVLLALFLLTGCQGAARAVEGVGKAATEGVVGRLLTDRSRAELLREHRDLGEHMAKVESHIAQGRAARSDRERGGFQDAKDSLHAAGRQLEPERIPLELGLRAQAQLDKVRDAFKLLRERHSIPPYTGFTATR